MKKSRFSDEQIAHALRQSEAGTPVAEITRKLGVSEATFYAWKKKFGSMGTAEIRELRQLREENAKLKRLVADLSLDKARLADAGVISRRTDGSTGPAPGKRPESPGGGSKRTVIWGMSASLPLDAANASPWRKHCSS